MFISILNFKDATLFTKNVNQLLVIGYWFLVFGY